MKIQHPGWECCTRPDLLAWWVRFRLAWVAERMAIAHDMAKRAEPRDQCAHGSAWAVAQPAMILDGHTQRVAEAHGVSLT